MKKTIYNFTPPAVWTKADLYHLLESSNSYNNFFDLDSEDLIDSTPTIDRLQKMPNHMHTYWNSIGVQITPCINHALVWNKILNALKFVSDNSNQVLYNSINLLVRYIYIIESTSKNTDISYSDPRLPFSIFISIPDSNSNFGTERLSENIIHEAMHLQLSLIEESVCLYSLKKGMIFSPWKKESRHPNGILHALYVFSILKYFWLDVYRRNSSSFSKQRVEEISTQMSTIVYSEIKDFYTKEGAYILKQCLAANHV